jgi:hypothetical protein
VIGVISKGAAQSWQMENRYKTMNEGKFDFGFAVDWMRKDLASPRRGAAERRQAAGAALVDQFYAEVQAMGGKPLGHVQPDRFVRQTLVAAAFAASAMLVPHTASAEVALKAVTAWGKNFTFVDMYMEWIKRVNEKGKGKIRIDYIGGPEVYPSFEQLEPLKRGVFATMVTSTAYIAGALPETNATWFGFGATPAQLREAGLVAAIDKITREKAGVMLLGMPLQMKFNVYTKKEIKGANLSGLKMRTTPIYDPVLKGLGASTLTVPPTELLTALESGIVDGFAWPGVAVTGPAMRARSSIASRRRGGSAPTSR